VGDTSNVNEEDGAVVVVVVAVAVVVTAAVGDAGVAAVVAFTGGGEVCKNKEEERNGEACALGEGTKGGIPAVLAEVGVVTTCPVGKFLCPAAVGVVAVEALSVPLMPSPAVTKGDGVVGRMLFMGYKSLAVGPRVGVKLVLVLVMMRLK
jgi:hypothetical protein